MRQIILTEYAIAIFAVLLIMFLLPLMIVRLMGKGQKGIDGLGRALFLVIVLNASKIVIAFIFLFVNPLRVLIVHRDEIGAIQPLIKRIMCIAAVVLPMLFSLYFIFEVRIHNFLFHKKNYIGKGSYRAEPARFRSSAQFRDELKERGLYADEKTGKLIQLLNCRFTGVAERLKQKYYYDEATMMTLDKEEFVDDPEAGRICSPGEAVLSPVFVYNCVLYLISPEDELKYAPVGRYEPYTAIGQPADDYPYFSDIYVECKILYVDGRVYALIGAGESYGVSRSFDTFERPFYVLLSETEDVTTYVNGRFFPHGAVETGSRGGFRMRANTTPSDISPGRPVNYPVRVVERVDRDAIDAHAAKLRAGILKSAIEEHFLHRVTRDMIQRAKGGSQR